MATIGRVRFHVCDEITLAVLEDCPFMPVVGQEVRLGTVGEGADERYRVMEIWWDVQTYGHGPSGLATVNCGLAVIGSPTEVRAAAGRERRASSLEGKH